MTKDERWKMHWEAFVKEMRWLQRGFKRGGGSMKVDIKIKGVQHVQGKVAK